MVKQKGDTPNMRKMLIELPDDVIKLGKKAAVDREVTFKALVADAIRQYIAPKKGREQ
jgi:hypothetical protein